MMSDITDKQMKEIGWEDYLLITRKWLEHYPLDIFTGVTGEPGVMFILAIRKAIEDFDDGEQRGINDGNP